MKAVVIGPGRVGCGFVGQQLRASGFEVIFAARNPQVVAHLNRVGRYRIRLVGGSRAEEILVEGIRAVPLSNLDAVAREIADADVVATAVTVAGLPDIARPLAVGLRRRAAPANVLAFENLIDAGSQLRALVARHLPDTGLHGFSGALVSRAIASRLGDVRGNKPLTFVGDAPASFLVDGQSLRWPLPAIEGMVAVEDYRMHALSKLYTFSAGHATAAYLGHLKGYRYIHTAIRDAEIRAAVLGAMHEGHQALSAEYGARFAGSGEDLSAIVARFDNAGLNDPVSRVGREPLRKLGSEDRLVGAARMAERCGIHPAYLILAIAAALCFEHEDDPSSLTLQSELTAGGVVRVLRDTCRLTPSSPLGRDVMEARARLASGSGDGNVLLRLRDMLWASETDPGPSRTARTA
ncbi:MAG: hypothetical protein ABJC60_04425 [Actinomycetota bacterium]